MALFRKLTSSLVSPILRRSLQTSARSFAEGQMPLTFASPTHVHYNGVSVKQIDVPSYSGSFGILPNHVPSLAVIKPGLVTVYEEGGDTKKFFVSSGTISVNDDSSVQVIAEEAYPIDQLDAQACKEGLSKAQQSLSSASSERDKAEALISIETYEALVKAVE